ncbi:MAG: NAD(P)-dependent oxidoreductase [Planctomycetaceae bacterium]
MDSRSVSCIGLGLLGSAMTSRLIGAGWKVSGFDISADRCLAFGQSGGLVATSALDAAANSILLLSLPTSDIAGAVLSEIESVLRPGTIVVDTTTGRPGQMELFARKLAARDIVYLDATVGGASQLMRDGEAILMCGGDSAAFDRCGQLFSDLARQTFYCGPSGSGARMKLVMNLVLGLNRAVLAEGLSFAERLGIDAGQTLEVLKSGPAWSRAMDHKGKKMLSAEFGPQARLAQHLKDVRLILELAEQVEAVVPLSQVHSALLTQLVEQGSGDLDNSAIIRAYQSPPGELSDDSQ